jgi:hypothetical protein
VHLSFLGVSETPRFNLNFERIQMSAEPCTNVILLDSIALIDKQALGCTVVSGSHGGASAAKFVLDIGIQPKIVFYNDAGGGKDDAGIVALLLLAGIQVPCATYAHTSARIGDAADGYANGIVTHANALAAAMGVRVGDRVRDVIATWHSAQPSDCS